MVICDDSDSDSSSSDDGGKSFVSRIAVANRGSGEGLLIESENESAQKIISLPTKAEPMYISAAILTNEFYIGDRTNNQLLVYDTTTLQQVDIIPLQCNGIFHQFYNFNNQLWVVCDQDNTLLVIDTQTRTAIQTITIDLENVPAGYIPHDLTTSKDYAYVTLLGPGSDGYVIQYSTQSFQEERRIAVGGDPHVWVDCCAITDQDFLYIAAQAASTVYKVDVKTLKVLETADVNGAHGIWATSDYLYVSDITASDGKYSLYVINQQDFQDIRVYDVKVGSPHNLIANSNQDKLFVTHSGPGAVTVYDIEQDGGLDAANGRIIFEEAGSVPFGIMNIVSFNEFQALSADDDSDEDDDDRR